MLKIKYFIALYVFNLFIILVFVKNFIVFHNNVLTNVSVMLCIVFVPVRRFVRVLLQYAICRKC